MFDLLSTKELTNLRRLLYEGTEEVFGVACLDHGDPRWAQQCREAHREIAALFIEVGTELFRRLQPQLAVA